ncbi:hypothetical protein EPD60_04045 [Flaviaesturariibacter flavus]|uniref:Outer membrane lipoprotein carrier protein LolA n=1 Tax=Flaviaesturariibacter flavus TaxID=2502780 RepID=A0A4R1BLX0_9BACT|nr:hypothetical protein [Flaviaesturariibacter flavus]TCJ18413.1 hypothetical protein EPD60_04045 [Flaviaesturariibacter flavus]
MRKYIWLVAGTFLTMLLFAAGPMWAQGDRSPEADRLLQGMMTQFKQEQSLSFDIRYRYSMATSPGIFLDSLNGTFKSSGGRMWYRLDSTETLLAKELTVIVFHEDRLIYLSRPAAGATQMNPAALLDSMLLKYKGMKASVSGKPGAQVLHLDMPPGTTYKKIDYYFGKAGYFPARVMCLVPSKALLDPAVQPKELSDEWCWVEVTFQNVRTEKIDDSVFATDRYILRKEKEFVPAPAFATYRVFIGAPELND